MYAYTAIPNTPQSMCTTFLIPSFLAVYDNRKTPVIKGQHFKTVAAYKVHGILYTGHFSCCKS